MVSGVVGLEDKGVPLRMSLHEEGIVVDIGGVRVTVVTGSVKV